MVTVKVPASVAEDGFYPPGDNKNEKAVDPLEKVPELPNGLTIVIVLEATVQEVKEVDIGDTTFDNVQVPAVIVIEDGNKTVILEVEYIS